MTQVGFSGSGTESPKEDQVNIGQGLQVGNTLIDFDTGKIKRENGSVSELIGYFRNFKKQSKDSNLVKTFVFKSKTKCTIKYQKTSVEYNLINEYIVLNGISTDKIEIERESTNISNDVFDWDFIASDDPNFKISIEKGTRDSDVETVLVSESRIVNNYPKNINVQGAKKIILVGKQTGGTGTVDVVAEVFDPASGEWVELIPKEDIFSLANGETKISQIGEGISRQVPKDSEILAVSADTGGVSQTDPVGDNIANSPSSGGSTMGAVMPAIGYVLPSGDSLFRIKANVLSNPATFSIGLIKVFN